MGTWLSQFLHLPVSGCLLPLALVVAVAIGVGVLLGVGLGNHSRVSDSVVVRVIDDGAPGGPAVVSTAVVPLR